MPGSRTISDADRAKVNALLNESSRNISDADREIVNALLNESGRTISDRDRAQLDRVNETTRELEGYMKRNDGGIASKTRVF